MTRRIPFNITLPKEVIKDIKKRNKFIAARYFEQKYREEFMNEEGLRAKLEELDKQRETYSKKIIAIQSTKTVIPKADSNRCPICTMFFNEDISIRKKIHIYKSLYACKECNDLQKMHIDKLVRQMKLAEASDNNA